ncbi:MAG: 30S ribosome-binding factor RbfA [Puniceicoccales bacterium]|jgi:ribosome-binding factor A|nr:30S ribosome-binding factor RbfA [Puniceicoccales bacterium]
MVDSFRLQRINEGLKRILSESLHRNFPTESVAITLTKVETSPDLRQAHVHYSVFDDGSKTQAHRFLRRVAGQLRGTVSRQTSFRTVPSLQFVLDTSLEKGHRIRVLLQRMEEKE